MSMRFVFEQVRRAGMVLVAVALVAATVLALSRFIESGERSGAEGVGHRITSAAVAVVPAVAVTSRVPGA